MKIKQEGDVIQCTETNHDVCCDCGDYEKCIFKPPNSRRNIIVGVLLVFIFSSLSFIFIYELIKLL